MAYNLPPAWDAGFALPDNVDDEGLERRGFVTKWMPRGEYDQPKVGTGGYAVPQFVMDEGYGQGTFTTKWRPRGTFDIPVPYWLNQRPKVLAQKSLPGGGNQVTIAALHGLGATEIPLYDKFGAKAAKVVLLRVQALPAGQRKQALKQILDRLDPTLYARTGEIARKLAASGMPPAMALAQGLARAMSSGIAAEIVRSGSSRTAPQPNTLLGLGCYRARGALGAWDAAAISQLTNTSSSTIGFDNTKAPVVHKLQVGPFIFPTVNDMTTTVTPADLGDQYDAFMKEIAKRSAYLAAGANMDPIHYGKPTSNYGLKYGLKKQISTLQGASYPIYSTGPSPDLVVNQYVVDGTQPIYYFEAPAPPTGIVSSVLTGHKRYGVYAKFVGTAAAPKWEISWKQNEPDAITKMFSSLTKLVAAIIDIAGDIVNIVGDLACQVAQSPGAAEAGGTAGVAAGAGAAAGQAGAAIAKSICGSGGQVPPGIPLPSASNNLLPLAIAGGAAIVLVAALTKKKKAP